MDNIKLIEGIIQGRKSKSIVVVELNGEFYDCYLPNQDTINIIGDKSIPCLLTMNTDDCISNIFYKVEAVSFDNESWLGINQTIIQQREKN